ncbi:MAG TPA: lipocalin family protein [Vicinamibacterales bacterium]
MLGRYAGIVAAACAAGAAVLLVRGLSAQEQGKEKPLRVAPDVDLERYTGKWFEIARLPNEFQDECASDVSAVYALRSDGRIDVTNRCLEPDGSVKEAKGVARRVDGQPPSILEVRFAPGWLSFLPNVWGDYQIIQLDPEYRHVLVGSPDRKYLWILARTPQLDESVYQSLLDAANAQGFDTSTMMRTKHTEKGDCPLFSVGPASGPVESMT